MVRTFNMSFLIILSTSINLCNALLIYYLGRFLRLIPNVLLEFASIYNLHGVLPLTRAIRQATHFTSRLGTFFCAGQFNTQVF